MADIPGDFDPSEDYFADCPPDDDDLGASSEQRDPVVDAIAARVAREDRVGALPLNYVYLEAGSPLASAKIFVERRYTSAPHRLLQHYNGTFYAWADGFYSAIDGDEMRAQIYGFLDMAFTFKKDKPELFSPNRSKVADVFDATKAETQLPSRIRPPCWLDGREAPNARDIVVCANGLLHLPTRELLEHTPALFTVNALNFAYDRDAPEPTAWLRFLAMLWPADQQSIETLQEVFGLLLTGETRHQKAFLLVGPKRSGKGTIARILTMLLGQENVCGPTLSSLGTNFGLQPMIGKRLALISDARLGGRADQQVIVERILSITGEDSITIDRKNRSAWTGRLEARFVVLSNELPRLSDASGALASRFITLLLTQSFYGREDLGLTEKLANELPGIMNWALDGWDRLKKRGYFVPPASAEAAQREMEDLGSPIGAFLRETCIVESTRAVGCDKLFRAWEAWCEQNNRDHPGTVQGFGRDLRAAVPGLGLTRPRGDDGRRYRYFQGLDVLSEADIVERDAK